MNEIDFKNWLHHKNYSKKVISDVVSRLKRIERINLNTDIDVAYSKDKCNQLLSIFKNKGANNEMNKLNNSSLPIGKYHLSTYKYALNLYLKYLNDLF